MIFLVAMQYPESLSARLFWLNVRFLTRNMESKQFSVYRFWFHIRHFFFPSKILYTIFVRVGTLMTWPLCTLYKLQSHRCISFSGAPSEFRSLIMLLNSKRTSVTIAAFQGEKGESQLDEKGNVFNTFNMHGNIYSHF